MMASQQNSGRTNAGNANHGALMIGWKSIKPKSEAATYPTKIPAKIGISLSNPLANKDTTTVVSKEMIASAQLPLAMSTPVPASERPMSIITGPTTTGGNRLVMKPTPRKRTNALMIP